jgi:hypothetical protein
MALSDYRPERQDVAFKGGVFAVRGLTLDDLGLLIRAHYDDLASILALYEESSAEIYSKRGLDKFVLALCSQAPGLVGSLITVASDETGNEAEAAVRRLPFPVMVDALLKVGTLTFEESGGLGNFLATCGSLLKGILPPEMASRLRMSPDLRSGVSMN